MHPEQRATHGEEVPELSLVRGEGPLDPVESTIIRAARVSEDLGHACVSGVGGVPTSRVLPVQGRRRWM